MKNRIALATLSAALAAAWLPAAEAQTPGQDWAASVQQLRGELQLARTTADDLASKAPQWGTDVGQARDESLAVMRNATTVQSLLYRIEQLQQGQSVYDDRRLDRLKEDADRLSEFAGALRAAIELNPDHPRWHTLRHQAKLASRTSARMAKAIEKLNG